MLVQAVSGLLVARIVGPVYMGHFLAVAVFKTYAGVILLGVPNGLNRELPLLVGQGRRGEVQALADTAWGFSRAMSVGIGVLFAIVGVVLIERGARLEGEVWLSYAITVPVALMTFCVEVTFRTSGNFLALSRTKLETAILALATVAVLLVAPWWGLLGRSVVLAVAYFVLLRRRRPVVLVPALTRPLLWRLVRIGLPIFSVGYVFSIFSVLDMTAILRYFGPREMGLYVPALQISAALGILPASVNQVIYPRMCELYGRTGTARSLAGLAYGPMLLLGVTLLPVFAFGWWLAEPFVTYLLPAYTDGIPAARWMIVSMYLWCLSSPQNVFATLNRLWAYFASIVFGGVTTWGLTIILVDGGWGLTGIGFARAAGMLVLVLSSAAFAARYVFGSEGPAEGRLPSGPTS